MNNKYSKMKSPKNDQILQKVNSTNNLGSTGMDITSSRTQTQMSAKQKISARQYINLNNGGSSRNNQIYASASGKNLNDNRMIFQTMQQPQTNNNQYLLTDISRQQVDLSASQSKGDMSSKNMGRASSRGQLLTTNKSLNNYGHKSPTPTKSQNNRSQKRIATQNTQINPLSINQNSNVIESQVNTVLHTAQNKLNDLDNEVEMLEQQNYLLQQQINEAQSTKTNLQDGNKQMQSELKNVKNDNGDLQKEKSNLEYQLRKVRDDIATMIDKADRKKTSLLRDIDNLKHQQLQILQTKQNEKEQYERQKTQNEQKIEGLSRELDVKEQEIENLKNALENINNKEMMNMQILDQRANPK